MNILFLLWGPVWDNFSHLIDLIATIIGITGAVAPDFTKKYGKKILLYLGIGLAGAFFGAWFALYTIVTILGVQ